MISLQSISVAAAAAGLKAEEEPRLFRFTLKHSLLLASIIGILALVYAYI
jgi:lactate permease